jgi:hypothetical protein
MTADSGAGICAPRSTIRAIVSRHSAAVPRLLTVVFMSWQPAHRVVTSALPAPSGKEPALAVCDAALAGSVSKTTPRTKPAATFAMEGECSGSRGWLQRSRAPARAASPAGRRWPASRDGFASRVGARPLRSSVQGALRGTDLLRASVQGDFRCVGAQPASPTWRFARPADDVGVYRRARPRPGASRRSALAGACGDLDPACARRE